MREIVNSKFDFFRGSEADQFNFYRIPKLLFADKRFSNVSVEAKVLYGLMLDRMSLSIKNGWIDDENRVYIYFKLEDAIEFLNIGRDRGIKLFAELDSEKGCGLINKIRQGLGKPMIIYVMNFNSDIETGPNSEKLEIHTIEEPETKDLDNADVRKSEIPTSGDRDSSDIKRSEKPNSKGRKNRRQEVDKSEASNTEYNNIKLNNTECNINPISSNQKTDVLCADEIEVREEYKSLILNNIGYENLLADGYDKEHINGLVDIMLDLVCSKNAFTVINGNYLPQELVKSAMLKLGFEHIQYVLDSLKNCASEVRNIRAYLITALYNSLSTIGHYYSLQVNHDMSNMQRRSEV